MPTELEPITHVRITTDTLRFRARLEWSVAPKTCAAFARLLPYRTRLVHVRWSGEALWAPLGEFDLGVAAENATSYPAPGQILWHPPGVSEAELLVAYGPCRFASRVGQLAGNHFMTIVGGGEALGELGTHALWHGAQDVLFEGE